MSTLDDRALDAFQYRPATMADLEAVAQVQQAQRLADYGEPHPTAAEDLAAFWPSIDLETDTIVVVLLPGQIVSYALWLPKVSGAQRSVGLLMDVLPAYRGGGIEAHLVRLTEQRAVALTPAAPPVDVWALVTNAAAQQALEQAGYTREISFQTMQIDLTAAPPRSASIVGIEIRLLRVGVDEQQAYEADEEASLDKGYGTRKTYEQWAKRLRLDQPDFDPTLCFLAWAHGVIAGGIYCERLVDTGRGVIHHLGVRRPWRRRGLGRALLAQVFAACYERNIRTIQLDVDTASQTGAERLYERVGMRTMGTRHRYTKCLDVGRA